MNCSNQYTRAKAHYTTNGILLTRGDIKLLHVRYEVVVNKIQNVTITHINIYISILFIYHR